MVDEVARRHPSRIAIDVPPGRFRPGRQRVTYAGLLRQADAVAAVLRPRVGRDALVPILLPRDNPALYASQLGVLRAGAAYVGLDPAFPDGHLGAVLRDCDAAAVLTDAAGRERLRSLGLRLPPIHLPAELPPGPPPPLPDDPTRLAYVVYTSGTTGRPKGVMIEHRSIANLVRANVGYFGLGPEDRVAQCSSPAYDSSVEEAWLAFAVGATLVPLDDDTVRLGPDLIGWLRRERISVLCPPPTLLQATGCPNPAQALPDLRLLYVGGEPLPQDLADRWAPGRRLENGYGPTECTVTVVRGPVRAGERVTIGRPVPGHHAWVLDGSLQEVPDGEAGELCLAGVGLARGYYRNEKLTAERFPIIAPYGRIYRTGDRVRRLTSGEFEHLGRLDAQVKVRGYRIELSAVEACLAAVPGVRAAACRVQPVGAGEILVAHVVPEKPDQPPAAAALKAAVRASLPEYMVPARVGFLDQLPTTVSGKLDRNALPLLAAGPSRTEGPPQSLGPDEQIVAGAFARSLGMTEEIAAQDDFFADLGGNSLAAAAVVADVRKSLGATVTVRDLYETRTAAGLAARLRTRLESPTAVRAHSSAPPNGRPLLVTTIQSLWLALEGVAAGGVLYVLAFEALPLLLRNLGLAETVLLAAVLRPVGLLAGAPVALAWTVFLKRALIGRYMPGRYPVWGGLFLRNWLVTHAARTVPWSLFAGTGLQAVALRALGARVGRGVHIHRGVDLLRGGWDLLEIGDGVTLAEDAEIRVADLDDGSLVFGPISLGPGSTIDTRGGVGPGTTVGPNGYLTALSWLPPGTRVPGGERWDGIPAGPAGPAPPAPATTLGGALSPAVYGTLVVAARCAAMIVAALPIAGLLAVISAVWPAADTEVLAWLEEPFWNWAGLALLAAGVVLAGVTSVLLQALLLRAVGRVRRGVASQWSWEAIRVGLKERVVAEAGRRLSGALFWPWWLRLAGMRVGRDCEISTVIGVVPETVTIGEGSFFADGIYLCPPRRHRGTIAIADTGLGRGTFLGNHAVVPAGDSYPDGLFIGVATVADPDLGRSGTAWFGHPPLPLSRRAEPPADRRLTHEPGPVRYANRLFWESLRFGLPIWPLVLGYGWYAALAGGTHRLGGTASALLLSPLVTGMGLAGSVLAAVALKWVLLGKVRPGQHPLWSCWCSRWDFQYMTWAEWARGPLSALEGTLWLNAILRLAGMRVGRRVVLGGGFAMAVDPDMIALGDRATVVGHFQAHSFEDRVLKIDRLGVGREATVGSNAVVFYGADVGDGAWVGPHAVVMKHEILEPHREYVGCPSQPAEWSSGTADAGPA